MSNFYLTEDNERKYQPEADARGMELGTYINDLLRAIDPKSVDLGETTYNDLYAELKCSVEKYCKDKPNDHSFVLRDIEFWSKLSEQGQNGKKASLGKKFFKEVEAGIIPGVSYLIDESNRVKLDRLRSVIYCVVNEKEEK